MNQGPTISKETVVTVSSSAAKIPSSGIVVAAGSGVEPSNILIPWDCVRETLLTEEDTELGGSYQNSPVPQKFLAVFLHAGRWSRSGVETSVSLAFDSRVDRMVFLSSCRRASRIHCQGGRLNAERIASPARSAGSFGDGYSTCDESKSSLVPLPTRSTPYQRLCSSGSVSHSTRKPVEQQAQRPASRGDEQLTVTSNGLLSWSHATSNGGSDKNWKEKCVREKWPSGAEAHELHERACSSSVMRRGDPGDEAQLPVLAGRQDPELVEWPQVLPVHLQSTAVHRRHPQTTPADQDEILVAGRKHPEYELRDTTRRVFRVFRGPDCKSLVEAVRGESDLPDYPCDRSAIGAGTEGTRDDCPSRAGVSGSRATEAGQSQRVSSDVCGRASAGATAPSRQRTEDVIDGSRFSLAHFRRSRSDRKMHSPQQTERTTGIDLAELGGSCEAFSGPPHREREVERRLSLPPILSLRSLSLRGSEGQSAEHFCRTRHTSPSKSRAASLSRWFRRQGSRLSHSLTRLRGRSRSSSSWEDCRVPLEPSNGESVYSQRSGTDCLRSTPVASSSVLSSSAPRSLPPLPQLCPAHHRGSATPLRTFASPCGVSGSESLLQEKEAGTGHISVTRAKTKFRFLLKREKKRQLHEPGAVCSSVDACEPTAKSCPSWPGDEVYDIPLSRRASEGDPTAMAQTGNSGDHQNFFDGRLQHSLFGSEGPDLTDAGLEAVRPKNKDLKGKTGEKRESDREGELSRDRRNGHEGNDLQLRQPDVRAPALLAYSERGVSELGTVPVKGKEAPTREGSFVDVEFEACASERGQKVPDEGVPSESRSGRPQFKCKRRRREGDTFGKNLFGGLGRVGVSSGSRQAYSSWSGPSSSALASKRSARLTTAARRAAQGRLRRRLRGPATSCPDLESVRGSSLTVPSRLHKLAYAAAAASPPDLCRSVSPPSRPRFGIDRERIHPKEEASESLQTLNSPVTGWRQALPKRSEVERAFDGGPCARAFAEGIGAPGPAATRRRLQNVSRSGCGRSPGCMVYPMPHLSLAAATNRSQETQDPRVPLDLSAQTRPYVRTGSFQSAVPGPSNANSRFDRSTTSSVRRSLSCPARTPNGQPSDAPPVTPSRLSDSVQAHTFQVPTGKDGSDSPQVSRLHAYNIRHDSPCGGAGAPPPLPLPVAGAPRQSQQALSMKVQSRMPDPMSPGLPAGGTLTSDLPTRDSAGADPLLRSLEPGVPPFSKVKHSGSIFQASETRSQHTKGRERWRDVCDTAGETSRRSSPRTLAECTRCSKESVRRGPVNWHSPGQVVEGLSRIAGSTEVAAVCFVKNVGGSLPAGEGPEVADPCTALDDGTRMKPGRKRLLVEVNNGGAAEVEAVERNESQAAPVLERSTTTSHKRDGTFPSSIESRSPSQCSKSTTQAGDTSACADGQQRTEHSVQEIPMPADVNRPSRAVEGSQEGKSERVAWEQRGVLCRSGPEACHVAALVPLTGSLPDRALETEKARSPVCSFHMIEKLLQYGRPRYSESTGRTDGVRATGRPRGEICGVETHGLLKWRKEDRALSLAGLFWAAGSLSGILSQRGSPLQLPVFTGCPDRKPTLTGDWIAGRDRTETVRTSVAGLTFMESARVGMCGRAIEEGDTAEDSRKSATTPGRAGLGRNRKDLSGTLQARLAITCADSPVLRRRAPVHGGDHCGIRRQVAAQALEFPTLEAGRRRSSDPPCSHEIRSGDPMIQRDYAREASRLMPNTPSLKRITKDSPSSITSDCCLQASLDGSAGPPNNGSRALEGITGLKMVFLPQAEPLAWAEGPGECKVYATGEESPADRLDSYVDTTRAGARLFPIADAEAAQSESNCVAAAEEGGVGSLLSEVLSRELQLLLCPPDEGFDGFGDRQSGGRPFAHDPTPMSTLTVTLCAREESDLEAEEEISFNDGQRTASNGRAERAQFTRGDSSMAVVCSREGAHSENIFHTVRQDSQERQADSNVIVHGAQSDAEEHPIIRVPAAEHNPSGGLQCFSEEIRGPSAAWHICPAEAFRAPSRRSSPLSIIGQQLTSRHIPGISGTGASPKDGGRVTGQSTEYGRSKADTIPAGRTFKQQRPEESIDGAGVVGAQVEDRFPSVAVGNPGAASCMATEAQVPPSATIRYLNDHNGPNSAANIVRQASCRQPIAARDEDGADVSEDDASEHKDSVHVAEDSLVYRKEPGSSRREQMRKAVATARQDQQPVTSRDCEQSRGITTSQCLRKFRKSVARAGGAVLVPCRRTRQVNTDRPGLLEFRTVCEVIPLSPHSVCPQGSDGHACSGVCRTHSAGNRMQRRQGISFGNSQDSAALQSVVGSTSPCHSDPVLSTTPALLVLGGAMISSASHGRTVVSARLAAGLGHAGATPPTGKRHRGLLRGFGCIQAATGVDGGPAAEIPSCSYLCEKQAEFALGTVVALDICRGAVAPATPRAGRRRCQFVRHNRRDLAEHSACNCREGAAGVGFKEMTQLVSRRGRQGQGGLQECEECCDTAQLRAGLGREVGVAPRHSENCEFTLVVQSNTREEDRTPGFSPALSQVATGKPPSPRGAASWPERKGSHSDERQRPLERKSLTENTSVPSGQQEATVLPVRVPGAPALAAGTRPAPTVSGVFRTDMIASTHESFSRDNRRRVARGSCSAHGSSVSDSSESVLRCRLRKDALAAFRTPPLFVEAASPGAPAREEEVQEHEVKHAGCRGKCSDDSDRGGRRRTLHTPSTSFLTSCSPLPGGISDEESQSHDTDELTEGSRPYIARPTAPLRLLPEVVADPARAQLLLRHTGGHSNPGGSSASREGLVDFWGSSGNVLATKCGAGGKAQVLELAACASSKVTAQLPFIEQEVTKPSRRGELQPLHWVKPKVPVAAKPSGVSRNVRSPPPPKRPSCFSDPRSCELTRKANLLDSLPVPLPMASQALHKASQKGPALPSRGEIGMCQQLTPNEKALSQAKHPATGRYRCREFQQLVGSDVSETVGGEARGRKQLGKETQSSLLRAVSGGDQSGSERGITRDERSILQRFKSGNSAICRVLAEPKEAVNSVGGLSPLAHTEQRRSEVSLAQATQDSDRPRLQAKATKQHQPRERPESSVSSAAHDSVITRTRVAGGLSAVPHGSAAPGVTHSARGRGKPHDDGVLGHRQRCSGEMLDVIRAGRPDRQQLGSPVRAVLPDGKETSVKNNKSDQERYKLRPMRVRPELGGNAAQPSRKGWARLSIDTDEESDHSLRTVSRFRVETDTEGDWDDCQDDTIVRVPEMSSRSLATHLRSPTVSNTSGCEQPNASERSPVSPRHGGRRMCRVKGIVSDSTAAKELQAICQSAADSNREHHQKRRECSGKAGSEESYWYCRENTGENRETGRNTHSVVASSAPKVRGQGTPSLSPGVNTSKNEETEGQGTPRLRSRLTVCTDDEVEENAVSAGLKGHGDNDLSSALFPERSDRVLLRDSRDVTATRPSSYEQNGLSGARADGGSETCLLSRTVEGAQEANGHRSSHVPTEFRGPGSCLLTSDQHTPRLSTVCTEEGDREDAALPERQFEDTRHHGKLNRLSSGAGSHRAAAGSGLEKGMLQPGVAFAQKRALLREKIEEEERKLEARNRRRPRGQGDTENEPALSDVIAGLKAEVKRRTTRWWRAPLESFFSFPLLSSYEFVGSRGTARVFKGELMGPNTMSLLSSNWHDRLQWSVRQTLQGARSAGAKKEWADKEILLCKEIGFFTAAARAAAVVLSFAYPAGNRTSASTDDVLSPDDDSPLSSARKKQARGDRRQASTFQGQGVASCFVEVTPENLPAVWRVYQPKFEDDKLFVFDSLVLTVVRGSRRQKISSRLARKVYANDYKGRQAACNAIYQMKTTSDISPFAADKFLMSDLQRQHLAFSTAGPGATDFSKMDLALPVCALVDYAGERIMVEPLMPIDPDPVSVEEEFLATLRRELPFYVQQCQSRGSEQLALDSVDRVDRVADQQLKFIGKTLNLTGCPFPFGHTDFEYDGLPSVRLWRSRVDQLCVVRNLQELLPPIVFRGKVHPAHRLREIFVRHTFDMPLPSTTTTSWTAGTEKSFSKFVRTSNPGSALDVLELAGEALTQCVREDLVLGVEALNCNFLDSADISHTLHQQGINMRMLGVIYSQIPGLVFRDSVLREMLARAAKHLFFKQLEVLVHKKAYRQMLWGQLLQTTVVALFNIVLADNEETRMFWQEQLLREVAEIFDVDLLGSVSPRTVCLPSLFKAMEFHLGVKFRADVLRKTEGASGQAVTLQLPLTTADLSTFTIPRESGLFPHVAFVRGAVLGAKPESVPRTASGRTANCTTRESAEHDAASVSSTEGSPAWAADWRSAEEAAAAREHSVTGVAALRAIRGFYPRVKVTLPTSLTVIETAVEQAKRFPCRADVSVDARASQMKAGLTVANLLPMVYGTANMASHGLGGAIRAAILGLAYPCHPYCVKAFQLSPVRTAEAAREQMRLERQERQAGQSLKKHSLKAAIKKNQKAEECLVFEGFRISLAVFLTVHVMLANDIVSIAKILTQLAYLLLQHGETKQAAAAADFIHNKLPDVGFVDGDARLIQLQCEAKTGRLYHMVQTYKRLVPELLSLEGPLSLRLMLTELLLTAIAFQQKQFSAVIPHGFKVYHVSALTINPHGSHWTGIAALRLIGKSLMELQRFSEAITVLEDAVRGGQRDRSLPSFVTCMNRYWLAVAFAKVNRLEDAKREASSAFDELEDKLGTNHPATLSTLYLLAETHQTIGCEEIITPPLKMIDGEEALLAESPSGRFGNIGQLMLYRPIRSQDVEVIERAARDKYKAKCREDSLKFYTALFRRLVTEKKYLYVTPEQHQDNKSHQKERLLAAVKQTLIVKLCDLPLLTLRAIAYRFYVLCVSQSGSELLKLLAVLDREGFAAGRGRSNRGSKVSSFAEADDDEGGSLDLDDLFVFHRSTSSYGSHHRPGADVLQASVAAEPNELPSREHGALMMSLLVFARPTPSIETVLQKCISVCKREPGLVPSEWFDKIVERIVQEAGTTEDLIHFISMVRAFFSPIQKRVFVFFLHVEGGKEDMDTSLLESKAAREATYADTLRKLARVRMKNARFLEYDRLQRHPVKREKDEETGDGALPDATSWKGVKIDYLDYDVAPPKNLDADAFIDDATDLVNASLWNGVTLRNLNSRLSEQLLHQDVMEEERSRSKRAGIMADEDGDDKPAGGVAEPRKAALATRQLLGKGCVSGQRQRRPMGRAAEIALQRFSRAGQLNIMASPLAYGLDQIEGLSRGSRLVRDPVDAGSHNRDLLGGSGDMGRLSSIR